MKFSGLLDGRRVLWHKGAIAEQLKAGGGGGSAAGGASQASGGQNKN
jgi:hypothetical protein